MNMIGDKNRKIAIWKPTGETDAANEPLPDAWVLHKEKWAKIKGETGMGTIRNAAMAGDVVSTPIKRYSYRVNYDTSITTLMQIRERDGSRLRIVSVGHDKANREWTDIVGEAGGVDG